jgi:nucleoside-diphosphate-sugar epimerase
MVNRSGKSAAAPQGVEIVAADAYTLSSAIEVTKGAAVIYQCAQPGYTEWVEKFPPLQASILEAAAANGAKLIVGENLYMYSEDAINCLHEELPYTTHTKKGRVRAAMAQAVIDAHKSGKVRTASARAPDFYGMGVLSSLVGERMFYPLLAGKAANMAGDVDVPHSITYIDDFGETLAILGERDEALGQAWHVPNAAPISQRQMVELAAKAAGVEPKLSAMGKTKVRIGGIFIPEAREMVEMMYVLEKPYIVDDSKFRRAFPETLKLGEFPTPLEKGMRVTVGWYRENPQVKH